MTSQLEQASGCISEHDHACAFYRSPDERARSTAAFINRSLLDGTRVLFITADRSRETALAELEAAGLAVRDAIDSGRLSIRGAHETYLAGGSFDADRVLALLRDQVSGAAADGAGFRVAGEIDWLPPSGVAIDAWLEYERRVDQIFRESGAAALCIYGARRFDSDACNLVASLHPLVLAEPREGARPWELCCASRAEDGTLALRGEVDVTNAELLAGWLEAELARRGTIRLDLSGLSFIDLSGLRAIERAAARLGAGGGHVSLGSPPYALRQILDKVGLAELPWLRLEER